MTPSEANEKIVKLTAEAMQLAERVLDLRNAEEESYNAEKPVLIEIVSVANLIVNMSVAGMYKVTAEDRVSAPSRKLVETIIAAMEPMIDAKIKAAMAPKPIPLMPRPTGGHVPPMVPPPSSGI